ncbi:MAG: c-type cytochrome [Vicinamibacterales bacterium]
MRISPAVIVFGFVVASSAVAGAQPPAGGAQAPPPMKNLQVIPADTPRQQVIQTMQTFTQGLGVRCEFCHVDEPGHQDFAADDKRVKKVAREMMRLTADLNAKIPAAVSKPAADATRVQCATCHRGVAIPRQLTEILSDTMTASGMPAATTQFRDLRKQYFGGQSYDFSEASLTTLAQRANQAGKPDDALAWLQLNLEFYPQSVRSYLLMSNVYAAKKDMPNAIKSAEKALEIDPQNAQAKQQLERLKK